MDTTAKPIVRWVALGALFLIPITPLIVTSSLFFPFITGKAFYFRILVEIVVCAWVVLALLDRAYRPRFSWIGAAAVAFVAWMFVADAFAVNATKAFWSNFERMEGWVLLIHLLGLFFAASAVLRVEKKWRAWFLTSIGVSVVVSCYALLQLSGSLAIHQGSTRIDATLGNSAYLAIYFLFNIFIAGWLALTSKQAWLTWSLIALAVVEGALLFMTETRGTVLALAGGLALAALLTVLTAGKKARTWAAGGLALIILFAGSFYLARDSAFVQGNHVLQRIASISLTDGQTRFTIWHLAWQGALERPIVGWGQEGFNYVFNKYYDPSLYGQESWFDRAHNAFIDWLSAGGIPAFLLYLSLFSSAFFLLWRSSELSRAERIALTAALAGYAVHNLFVFDNLYSYVYFFMILALVDSQVSRPMVQFEGAPELPDAEGVAYGLPMAAVAIAALIWLVNVPGLTVGSGLIGALSSPSVDAAQAAFSDLAAHPAYAAQEVREQIVSFAGSVVQSTTATNEQKQKAAALAISEMQKQVAAYPLDARERLQLAFIYRVIGDNTDALKEVQVVTGSLSPGKVQAWIEQGTIEWNLGNAAAARDDFKKAYELAPQFHDLAAYAAAGDIAAGDTVSADRILLATYGTTMVDSDVLAVAYYHAKLWPRLIDLWKLRVKNKIDNPSMWFGLASAYYASGDAATAIQVLNEVKTRFPDAAGSVDAAVAQIRAGR